MIGFNLWLDLGLLREFVVSFLPMGIAWWLAKQVGKHTGLWGGDPKPPDIEAERFQYDNKWIEDWVSGATTDVTRQTEQWLQKAMTGIHGAEHTRGLTEGGGWAGAKGTESAGFGAENLATALANIKAQAAGMEHTGMLQSQQMYADEYQKYLDQLYQDQEDWIAQIMQYIPIS